MNISMFNTLKPKIFLINNNFALIGLFYIYLMAKKLIKLNIRLLTLYL